MADDADLRLRAAESEAVTLARMEGKFDNLTEKVGGIVGTVAELRRVQDKHTLDIAQLRSDAIAKDLTVIATAKALSEAKEAADATSRAEITKSERAWSPLAKLMAVIASLTGIVIALTGIVTAFAYVAKKP